MKKLSMLISFIVIITLLGACGTSNQSKSSTSGGTKQKTVVMGTSADYAPYESVDTTKGNDVVGFDVDIAKYITSKLGYKLKIKNMEFKGLLAALNTHRVDFVMAGMTPTPERKKSVDFSDVYYKAQQLIMTRKGTNIKSINDLKGKTVGVQLGAIQQQVAKRINKKVPITIKTMDNMNILVEELKSKRIDGVVIEDAVAARYLASNKNLQAFPVPGETSAGSAIAFPKDSKLTKPFNDELNKMMKNGKLNELVQKWFKVSSKS